MKPSLEIEAKTLLSKKVYTAMRHAFTIKQDFTQCNYYFDSRDFALKKASSGLRIRLYDDRGEQTLKVKRNQPVQQKFHEVNEITDLLSRQKAKTMCQKAEAQQPVQFEGSVKAYLKTHQPQIEKSLYLFAWSETRRILAAGPEQCELTLDATIYLDGSQDYELEIENPEPLIISQVLPQLEQAFHFKSTRQNTNQNKVARAFLHTKKD